MKKLNKFALIGSLLISVNFANQALAKTEGSYVGVNVGSYQADHDLIVSDGFIQINTEDSFSEKTVGFGLEFKHAFNYDGFFVAPSVFFDFMRNEAQNRNSDEINLNNRIGAKVDVGYDVTERFSPYLSLGLSSVSYEANVTRIINNGFGLSVVNLESSGREISAIYGLGLLFNLNDNISFNIEASRQEFEGDLGAAVGYDNFETEITSIKFGAFYKF